MPFSNKWTEWHLTPHGWEAGSQRIDASGTTTKDPPTDRVQTVRWSEVQASPFAKMLRKHVTRWESSDKDSLEKLRKQFGEPPQSL